MFCTVCGKKNSDEAKFCYNCGFSLAADPENGSGAATEDTEAEQKDTEYKSVGNIKKVIDAIIARKGKGDPLLIINIRKKLVLKGINPAKYTCFTIDDPLVLKKLQEVAKDLGFRV